jgi:hypothetical protein
MNNYLKLADAYRDDLMFLSIQRYNNIKIFSLAVTKLKIKLPVAFTSSGG